MPARICGLAIVTLWLSSVLAPTVGQAQTGEGGPRLSAVRAQGAIVVDGRLDEPDWARAAIATRFIQSEPAEGQPVSETTDARVLYDDHAVYIGVFAGHTNASDIIVNELKRDFDGASTDWVAVILDPFHDRRNGYQFGVNPAGAAWDSQKFNEGRERNLSWDGVWTVRTTIAANGWYAEFAIPFRTLQFSGANPQTWGINFQRHLQGRLENSFWAPIPRQYFLDRLSLAGTLEGLHNIRSGANLRVKPYVAARARRTESSRDEELDVGVDAKYGITTGLTADVTVNTDFSQVEADVQQVGATRFNVLFPEKREFFLENSGVFQFGPGSDRAAVVSAAPGASAGGRDNSVQNDLALFFSRRIGLAADGSTVPIIAGARLSGRVGGTSVGALYIRQRSANGEPESGFTVLRARRHAGSASDVGVMLVERNESGPERNRVVGVDVNLRPLKDLLVYGYAAKPLQDPADENAHARDTAASTGIVWRDRRWVGEASYGVIGARFVDDVGFVPRAGIERSQALFGRRFRPTKTARWLREIYPVVGVTTIQRENGDFDSRYWEQRLTFTFENGASLELGANPNVEDLRAPFLVSRTRGLVVAPGRYEFTDRFVSASTSRSKPITFTGRASAGTYYDGSRNVLQLGVNGRVNTHLSGSLSVTRDAVQLTRGDAVTHLIVARANYGFSTRLFLNALVQYNTDTRQSDANVRFNFIHRPLSDLFVVFSNQRSDGRVLVRDRSIAVKITRLLMF